MLPPLLPNPLGPLFKTPNGKRISPTEMQLRREKGLCYFCDEKFSFNHKCPNCQLYFLQLMEEKLVTPVVMAEAHPNGSEVAGTNDHHLSLNTLKGGLGVGTIKFVAHVGTIPIKVLIDGGSSCNFLQPRVAQFLNIPVETNPRLSIHPSLTFQILPA